jgi:Pyridoxamine 5'-phosphate oxidase
VPGTATASMDPRFSSPSAVARPWAETRAELDRAGVYWLSTVRADGRPHVTTLIAVWFEGALYFCTGPGEQKAKNLAANPHSVLTTGRNTYDEGLDVVVEGDAVRITDDDRLQAIAGAFEQKYGSEWHFDVRDGAFAHADAPDPDDFAHVFEVVPVKVLAFAKGEPFSQTRYRF